MKRRTFFKALAKLGVVTAVGLHGVRNLKADEDLPKPDAPTNPDTVETIDQSTASTESFIGHYKTSTSMQWR